MKKVVITATYSFSYRNIVFTGVLDELLSSGATVHIFLPEVIFNSQHFKSLEEKYEGKLVGYVISEPKKRGGTHILFILLSSWMLKLQNTYTYRIKMANLFEVDKIAYLKFGGIAALLPNSKRVFNFFRRKFLKIMAQNKDVDSVLSKINPDVMFFLLNNKLNEYHYISYANRRNVPTISLIHSWDVITTKGHFLYSTDTVMCWNYVNQYEYEQLVDGILNSRSKLEIVGVPQFDIYDEPNPQIEKEKLELGVPLNKKIVLYTTTVDRLFPNEDVLIKRLIDWVSTKNDYFLYIRIHPQAKLDEFVSITTSSLYHLIIRPEKVSSTVDDGVQFSPDTLLRLKRDILISDVVVNLASSISLDASVLGRPVINICFDIDDIQKSNLSVKRFYRTDHFSKLISLGQIGVAYTFEGLVSSIVESTAANNSIDVAVNTVKQVYSPFCGASSTIVSKVVLA